MPRPSSPVVPASLRIEPEPFVAAGARWVVAQAEAELVARYGRLADNELSLCSDVFAPPRGAFVVGRLGSDTPPVGGVGLRPVTETIGEIKRLWVDSKRRGHGIGRALMAAIEATAHDLGYQTLRLETGPKQPEAVALYTASRWTRHQGGWDAEGCISDGVIRFFKSLP